jgi:hypothetical protein
MAAFIKDAANEFAKLEEALGCAHGWPDDTHPHKLCPYVWLT